MWPLNASMEPTLASQITKRQFEIPFGGMKVEYIPSTGTRSHGLALIIPPRGVGAFPREPIGAGVPAQDRARFHSQTKRLIVFRLME